MTKLSYRIHWVDDSQDWVESVKDPIKRDFENDEVCLEIETFENGNNIESELRKNPADLVILDYNLPGKSGIELVQDLRKGGNLTEIIFYSQDDAKKSEFKSWDGVHSCRRDDASEKLSTVITRFIDRTKNIAIMRGMIISEAIDCENYLTQIILNLFGDKSDIFRDKVLDKAYLDFEKKRMLVASVLKDKRKLEARDGASHERIALIANCIECIGQMKNEIVDQRNILAHSEKTVNEEGVLILRGLNKSQSGIEFTNHWKNEIRGNINKHLVNLRQISEILSE